LCLIKRKNNLFFVVSEHAAVTIEGIQCRYCNFKATSSSLIQDHCSSVHKGKTVNQKKDQIVQQNTPKAEQLNPIQKGLPVHKGKTVDQKKDQIVQQNRPKAEQLNPIQKGLPVHKGKTVDQKKDQIVQQNTPKAEQNTEQVATDQLNLIQKGGRTSMRSCDVCQKVFQRNYALVLHLQSVHLRERRYQCSDCPKGFSSKKDLKRHTGKMLKKY
jgi:uncharacterized Zn-finger protein